METAVFLARKRLDTAMGRPRRSHAAQVMTEVGTAALGGDKTPAERAEPFDRHADLIDRLNDRTREKTIARTVKVIEEHDYRSSTITADNGTARQSCKDVEVAVGVIFYFATPNSSFERGGNGNTEGLIGQHLSKLKSVKVVGQNKCDAIAYRLNARPRKRPGYQSPRESLCDYYSVLHVEIDIKFLRVQLDPAASVCPESDQDCPPQPIATDRIHRAR